MKRIVALFLALVACARGPGEAVEDAALVQTARDVVALLGGYNCERLPLHLTADAPAFFRVHVAGELLDGIADPVERVCFVLGVVQDYPRSETMDVLAESQSASRVDLILTDGSIRAELRMVRDAQGWKIEKEWALKQVQDLQVRLDLLEWAITEDGYFYYGPKAFTDNPTALGGVTQTVMHFVSGVAEQGSPVGLVHASLGPGAKSVCGSALSISGELFMIRQAANGSATYTRGPELPRRCPGRPLQPSW